MKRSHRVAAIALTAGVTMAGVAGVASAGDYSGSDSTSGSGSVEQVHTHHDYPAGTEEQTGPVRGVVDGVGGLLGGVADTVDGVVGSLL